MAALISNATAVGAGTAQSQVAPKVTFHGFGSTTSGTGTATIYVEVSNDGENWLIHDTISLTLSTVTASAGIEMNALWGHIRGRVGEITGTGASVSLHNVYEV